MFDFDRSTELNLVKLSKRRPEYGEICLVEAAVMAAGYESRRVKSFPDCPDGFSKPVTEYAFLLNDYMPDDLRNELLKPFIPRLAGIAGSPELEKARTSYIIVETMRRITSLLCREKVRSGDFVQRCEAVRTLEEVQFVGKKLDSATSSRGDVLRDAVGYSYKGIGSWVDMDYAVAATRKTASVCKNPRAVYTIAAQILDGAINCRG